MLNHLKLNRRFTVLSVIIICVGCIIASVFLLREVERQRYIEMQGKGLLLLETVNAVRLYNGEHVAPLLQEELYNQEDFIPEIVPAFAARQVFENFREQEGYGAIQYKEAMLNPMNPADMANAFEQQIINEMRANTDIESLSDYLSADVLYVARPIVIRDESCLTCHSTPEAAPLSLVRNYGRDGGFGWQMGETVGAQIIYVPAAGIFPQSRGYGTFIATFLALFVAVVVVLNVMLITSVTQPVVLLSHLAQKVRRNELTAADLEDGQLADVAGREDEVGGLARTFRHMAEAVQQRTAELSAVNGELMSEVDERRSAEEALRLSESRQRVMLDAIPDMSFCVDRDGRFVDYRPGRSVKAVFQPEAFLGKNVHDVWPVDFATTVLSHIHAALNANSESVWEYRLPVESSDRDFEARFLPLEEDKALVLVRDITEAKRLEQSMLQAQKLESVGVLAGGIAHDFNNLLTGMLGQTSLALYKMDEDAAARRHVEKAVAAAERAANLTRQLLAYAGKGQFFITEIDLNQLVTQYAPLLETAIPANTELVLTLSDEALLVQADVGQMQQVVMNLIINAAEAAESGGRNVWVEIREENVGKIDDVTDFVKKSPPPGRFVVLEVRDNGHGISEGLIERIFDPYFSTKQEGRGLGLSATLGAINNCGGYLKVLSEPGVGTTMRVYLPRAEKGAAEAAGSGQLVLVVDDDSKICLAIEAALENAGINTLVAYNGYQAIELYQKYSQAIRAVVLDIHMPLMSGQAVYEAMLQIDPAVRVILLSGYVNLANFVLPQRDKVYGVVQKPFVIDILVGMTRQALEADEEAVEK